MVCPDAPNIIHIRTLLILNNVSIENHLLDHLILVLDEQLHPLDGGGGGLGHARGHAGQHEVLSESQLLLVSHGSNVFRIGSERFSDELHTNGLRIFLQL